MLKKQFIALLMICAITPAANAAANPQKPWKPWQPGDSLMYFQNLPLECRTWDVQRWSIPVRPLSKLSEKEEEHRKEVCDEVNSRTHIYKGDLPGVSAVYIQRLNAEQRIELSRAYQETSKHPIHDIELPAENEDDLPISCSVKPTENNRLRATTREYNQKFVKTYMQEMATFIHKSTEEDIIDTLSATWPSCDVENYAQYAIKRTANKLQPGYKGRPMLFGINLLLGIATGLCTLKMLRSPSAGASRQTWGQAMTVFGLVCGAVTALNTSLYKKDSERHKPWGLIVRSHFNRKMVFKSPCISPQMLEYRLPNNHSLV